MKILLKNVNAKIGEYFHPRYCVAHTKVSVRNSCAFCCTYESSESESMNFFVGRQNWRQKAAIPLAGLTHVGEL